MIHGNYGYVYMIRCKVTNKLYIGQRKGCLDRKYWGSGVLIKKAIKKYGIENFERTILDCCDNQEELNRREIAYISLYRKLWSPGLYNILDGGHCFAGYVVTEETRNKIRESLKRNGKLRGKKQTPELIMKRAAGLRNFYREHPEIIEKKRAFLRSCRRITKKVKCIETGVIYNSIKEAAIINKIHAPNITEACRGRNKTSGGYHWEYV